MIFSPYNLTDSVIDILGGLQGVVMFLVFILFYIKVWWEIFKKAGSPGFYAIIPFLNIYTLCKIAKGKDIAWIYFILMFVPIVNIAAGLIVYYNLGVAFGKETGFCIGIILLSPIFLPILAFGKSEYLGPEFEGQRMA